MVVRTRKWKQTTIFILTTKNFKYFYFGLIIDSTFALQLKIIV